MAGLTHERLVTKVLQRLKVLAASETADPDDAAVVEEAAKAAYAMIEYRGLSQWAEGQDVPWEYAYPFRDLIAELCAGEFGSDFVAPDALTELTRGVTPDYRYDETEFQDF